jgi:hypothetical protein
MPLRKLLVDFKILTFASRQPDSTAANVKNNPLELRA